MLGLKLVHVSERGHWCLTNESCSPLPLPPHLRYPLITIVYNQQMSSWFLRPPVKQLHSDFLRAGADVIQAFSFYATDGKLRSNVATKDYTVRSNPIKTSKEEFLIFNVLLVKEAPCAPGALRKGRVFRCAWATWRVPIHFLLLTINGWL